MQLGGEFEKLLVRLLETLSVTSAGCVLFS
jgi:hypothetical protein